MIRSYPMKLGTIIFTEESTWNTLNFLASTDNIMFADQNSYALSKKHRQIDSHAPRMVKRCEDLLSRFDTILPAFAEFKVPLKDPTQPTSFYIKRLDNLCLRNAVEPHKYFESVEQLVNERFGALEEQLANLQAMRETRTKLVEQSMAGRELEALFPQGSRESMSMSANGMEQLLPLREDGQGGNSRILSRIVGFIETKYLLRFLQLINRVGREQMEIRTKNLIISEKLSAKAKKDYEPKSLVVIYFLVSGRNYLQEKVHRALLNFGFSFLNQDILDDNVRANFEVEASLEENESLCIRSEELARSLLKGLAETTLVSNLSDFQSYKMIVQRELRFARNLIFLRHKNGFNQLLIWVPANEFDQLKLRLDEMDPGEFGFVKPKLLTEQFEGNDNLKPPTLLKTNAVTKLFQEIVNVYAIPKYQEINPTPFMVISFPFFFGLMFGDVCHGLIILSFGFFAWNNHSKSWETFRSMSRILMLMGFFSMYCGLIYNQFFSVAFVTQIGCFDPQTLVRRDAENCHPVGLDWVWSIAANATVFINSFKMKFSIIIGVTQMLLGLSLKIANTIFFRAWIDLFFEAIPQFIFMLSTFGYMVLLIFIKWNIPYVPGEDVSILSTFVNFPIVKQPLYGGPGVQQGFQIALLVIALVSILLMYLPKPILLYFKHKNEIQYHSSVDDNSGENLTERSMISVSLSG